MGRPNPRGMRDATRQQMYQELNERLKQSLDEQGFDESVQRNLKALNAKLLDDEDLVKAAKDMLTTTRGDKFQFFMINTLLSDITTQEVNALTTGGSILARSLIHKPLNAFGRSAVDVLRNKVPANKAWRDQITELGGLYTGIVTGKLPPVVNALTS